jgi:malate dehydrogenase (oxaloacetate-decarboxylating)
MTDAKDAEALRRHAETRGKVQMAPKCAIAGPEDFAVWYTPGVAAPCRAIQAEPGRVYELTNRGNTIAIVSDGSRVLGLGNIGPEAGLPVMEGKALLFKVLGGVDAVPLCVRTREIAELAAVVRALEPSFGGINLEDIAQPGCFRVLDELRASLSIPVWHDDQQGTATAVHAALANALALTGRSLAGARIALVGTGAANVAVYRLLKACGAEPGAIVACDSRGTLHRGRGDIEAAQARFPDKWAICTESNAGGVAGGIAEALRGADACIAFARPGPGVIRPEWVRGMARDAIVFACANPVPEIWPEEAKAAGARIVATGRSDLPNQLNNSLVFPGVFRGTLDAGARAITDAMALAAARELARCGEERGLREDALLPRMQDWDVVPRIAAATAMQAQADGVARRKATREEYLREATERIRAAREAAGLC